jgi:predicted enzyme related to lactoylglutathione lyase
MPGTINTVGVASVDRAVEQIARCGGQIVEPRIVIPGVGYQAYCKDTEDVMFGIHQFDRSAK